MKHLLLGLAVVLLLGSTVAWTTTRGPSGEFEFLSEAKNPVSSLKLNNSRDDFQFAIISDRTGGHRSRVFSKAVEQLNLMQPEFVVCVGDLIEGYTQDKDRLVREWREFQTYVSRLEMPFFYVPGNHDLANALQARLWKQKFGRTWYEFVYRDVLFLCLNSEDPPGRDPGSISEAQLAWLKKTLADNARVRWTLVFLHKPMWLLPEAEKNGWSEAEALLKGRSYTVFAGHVHTYRKFVRQGQNYYMLATTGGASRMRGVEYGEFDHLVWVTMKKDGPVLANLLLDGILPEDLRLTETAEEAAPTYHRRPTHPVTVTVTLDGKPLPGAYVVFKEGGKELRPVRGDGVTAVDGVVRISTWEADDGLPVGEYRITVAGQLPFGAPTGKPELTALPARYASEKTSGLTATIKPGPNTLALELTK
jgi:hypothetical protein